MYQRRLDVVFLLAACLGCSSSFVRAGAPVEPIVGRWELVGIGDADGNTARPDRLIIDMDASGTFDYQLWTDGDAKPFRLSGHWTAADDVLRLWPQDGETLKASDQTYRITWDRGTLVLHRVEDNTGDPVPLRFARTIGSAP